MSHMSLSSPKSNKISAEVHTIIIQGKRSPHDNKRKKKSMKSKRFKPPSVQGVTNLCRNFHSENQKPLSVTLFVRLLVPLPKLCF